jgi:hypothetical protein
VDLDVLRNESFIASSLNGGRLVGYAREAVLASRGVVTNAARPT